MLLGLCEPGSTDADSDAASLRDPGRRWGRRRRSGLCALWRWGSRKHPYRMRHLLSDRYRLPLDLGWSFLGFEARMKKLTLLLFLSSCFLILGAIPPPYQPSQFTTNVAKASTSNSVFVITNTATGWGHWVVLSAASGSFIDTLNGNGTNTTFSSPVGGGGAAIMVDTNVLVVTNGFVGIRSSAMGWILNVAGDILCQSNLVVDSKIASFATNLIRAVIYASSAGGSSYPFLEAGNLVLQARSQGAGRDIVLVTGFGTSPTNTAVFDRNGMLGVGTNSPKARIHAVGNGSYSNLIRAGTTVVDPVFGWTLTVRFLRPTGSGFLPASALLLTSGSLQDLFTQLEPTERTIRTMLPAIG